MTGVGLWPLACLARHDHELIEGAPVRRFREAAGAAELDAVVARVEAPALLRRIARTVAADGVELAGGRGSCRQLSRDRRQLQPQTGRCRHGGRHPCRAFVPRSQLSS